MNLEQIKEDKELVKNLTKIKNTLDSVINDDITYDHNKLVYQEHEINITYNHLAVNEHIMFNRLKKVGALAELSKVWNEFKTYYANDNILNKIGEEFISGRFNFDDKILKDMKEYPFRQQVLYYFQKKTDVVMPEVTGADFEKFKSQILPDVEKSSKERLELKTAIMKSISEITSDKSSESLKKQWILSEDTPLGTVEGNLGSFLYEVRGHVKRGDFKFEQNGSKVTVEVPIAGTIKNGEKVEKLKTSVFTVDLNNSKDYSMQVGSLEVPKLSIEDRIKGIRNTLSAKPQEPKFKIV